MRNSTIRSLSCVGCLIFGPAGSALETAEAAASHLGGSLRQRGRRLTLVTIGRAAGRALAAVRGSRQEVRVRDTHGHPGDRAVAPDRIGDDLGGLLASAPAVPGRGPVAAWRRGRLGRPALSLGAARRGRPGPANTSWAASCTDSSVVTTAMRGAAPVGIVSIAIGAS